MTYDFERFCGDCARSLTLKPGTPGREEVRRHVVRLLQHPEFVEQRLGPDVGHGRHTLWEDPETGIRVLAHLYKDPFKTEPHDHGSSWAIYGNITRHTDITEWRRNDDGGDEGPAAVEPVKTYRIESGNAGLFDIGVIHSIDVPPDTRFLRVEGVSLDNMKTHRFDLETGTVRYCTRLEFARAAPPPASVR